MYATNLKLRHHHRTAEADLSVRVACGDIVFGDVDGVVVIPAAAADEAIARALVKVTSENRTRDELLEGRLLGDVYAKYGVL